MKQIKLRFLFVLFAGLLATACNNDDDNNQEPDNEEEEITRVVVNVENGGTTNSYTFNSLNSSVAETILLSANTTYNVSVEFWNDEETPAEDVTEEVKEEGTEHLVCLTGSGLDVAITRDDVDANGWELGLESTWVVGAAGTGTVKVNLKHQPDLKTATVNCAAGESDVDIDFPVTIQ